MTRTDRQIVFVLFAFTLALYLRTMVPGVLPGDPGELMVAAWRWGLAHPTGYPLYLLIGGAWQHLLAMIGADPAWALNAFSGLIGALAVVLLYVVMRNWLPGSNAVSRAAAIFTATLFAVNPTFWSQNLIAEVYTLHVLFVLLILVTIQRLEERGARGEETTRNTQHGAPSGPRNTLLVTLSFLVGLSLAHHAMTLLLLPSLLVTLLLLDRRWGRSSRSLIRIVIAGVLPLSLYLYVPLRSGLDASPWYHQRLGDGRLTLYDNTWPAFWDFVTGRSISVGFYDLPQALANVPQAWLLWRLHFTWLGLGLVIVGLLALIRQRNWPILALTLGYVVIQQAFNLFYAIGDILVYYIPLYLMATIWAGFGVHALANGIRNAEFGTRNTQHATRNTELAETSTRNSGALFLVLICFLLPLWLVRDFYPRLNQSAETATRQQWEEILATQPPADAILISNDRNEIVPLFYLQAVEGRATGMTGLFPLIKPGVEFADIGATTEMALAQGGDQPVYLIKPMPGLELKFALEPVTPLVHVVGPTVVRAPMHPLDKAFGPLRLLGYDWQPLTNTVQIKLYWSVQEKLPADYTTTVQLFDAAGEKITQDDRAPGGVYYPTSLWKPGETLVESHTIDLLPGRQPAVLLVGMYTGPEFTQLASPLKLTLSGD